jgi:CRP-like cAMP-binding protein
VRESFAETVLPKGASLVQPGRVCRHLYFLQEGALRGFYLLDGKEVTHWFSFAPEFVTSFHSFTTATASLESIQLLEGSVLRSISKEQLTGLLNRFHELERLVRLAYEHYYIRLEERYVNAQFRTASERYVQLLEQEPHLLERVPLQYIASWLGISAETLSRVRASLNKPASGS